MTLKITETILRDGQQSLIATRLKMEDILPVLSDLDNVGYHALEVWGGATFDSCLRYLGEDPWERLRIIRENIRNTKLQMLLRGQNILGYKHYPDDVLEKFVEKSVENGIDIIRIFDALNDIRNMKKAIYYSKKYGAHVQGSIVYTTSPIHTMDKFMENARELVDEGVDSLCIKDMAGLMTPFKAYELVKRLKENFELPIEMHSHNTAGLGAMTYLKAVEAGIDIIDTSISALGSGSAQPATESMTAALEKSEFDTDIKFSKLVEIAKYFRNIRGKYEEFLGSFEVDPRIISNQIPGGMISNLRSQLKAQGISDRYQEILEEIPRVREDLGYPPLVTPTSQIVGTQAVFNVVANGRYSVVPTEVKEYLRGKYGRPPGKVNEELRKELIKEEDIITDRPANHLEPIFDKKAEEIKDFAETEEDVLSYILFPDSAKKFLEAHYV
jgi:pyruvate/oxaloacetate carboxyltransferase